MSIFDTNDQKQIIDWNFYNDLIKLQTEIQNIIASSFNWEYACLIMENRKQVHMIIGLGEHSNLGVFFNSFVADIRG